MRKNILGIFAAALLLVGCDYNDKHFDGLDDLVQPYDKVGIAYTLSADDYKAIADNKDNQAIAKAKDDAASAETGEEVKVNADALAALTTKKAFNEIITVEEYAPAFISKKWEYKDESTELMLTYNIEEKVPEYLEGLSNAEEYTVTLNNYETVWGDTGIEYFTPKKPLKNYANDILVEAFPEATKDAVVLVNFNFNTTEPGSAGKDPIIFSEDFEELEGEVTWFEQNTVGDRKWQVKEYSNNKYLQYSAFKSGAKEQNYLVTPAINVKEGAKFSFDVNVGNFNGKVLTVFVSDDFKDDVTKAKWVEITSSFTIPEPEKGYSNFQPAGTYDLKGYVGKKVSIAFVYTGDGTDGSVGPTTTVQIDNVLVSTEATKAATRAVTRAADDGIQRLAHVYKLGGTDWYHNDKTLGLNQDDYALMGIKEFDKDHAPEEYLPKLLDRKVPFYEDGKTLTVLYKFDKKLLASDYVYNKEGDSWAPVSYSVEESKQFVYSKGEWKFNPSRNINLPAEKGNVEVSKFYQTIVDWVWENIDKKELGLTDADKKEGKGYMTKYGNNEYYFGASGFQNNMDFRFSKFREQYAAGYPDMDDAKIKDVVFKRVPEAFKIALTALYSDAKPAEGMEVVYTVNFGGYDGTNLFYTIQFEVVGNGQFEYIENSFQQVK